MDYRNLINNRNIDEEHSIQEPGLSSNVRRWGPYKAHTIIESLRDGFGGMGGKLLHSVELPEGAEPDEEMAKLVAKDLAIEPSQIIGLQPGHTWMKGHMNFDETMGHPDPERFQRINNMMKK